MNLCIDIGNTFIKIAIIKNEDLLFFKSQKKWLVRDIKNLKKKFNFQKAIISTVRKSLPRFWPFIEKTVPSYNLDHKLPIPIKNHYDTPKTLGKDRIAAAVGAFKAYKGNNLVIDIGTCITLDYIDKRGNYWGGNISPGIELRLKAMHQFTANLPSVRRKTPKIMLGTNTVNAINNGAIWGIVTEIEAYKDRITTKYGRINVILTGGDGAFFGDLVNSKIFVNTNLVLFGLNEILVYQ